MTMKLQPTMPGRLKKKQSVMLKTKLSKDERETNSRAIPKKTKRERCRPPDDKPMAQNSWAEIQNRGFYHRCPRPGHQNQLLPEQYPQRWHRPMCRICGQFQETIDHVVVGCSELAKTEYLHRRNKAATYLHGNICKEFNINTKSKWYEHEPQTESGKDDITILRGMSIQRDRGIKANRPDIVIHQEQKGKKAVYS